MHFETHDHDATIATSGALFRHRKWYKRLRSRMLLGGLVLFSYIIVSPFNADENAQLCVLSSRLSVAELIPI